MPFYETHNSVYLEEKQYYGEHFPEVRAMTYVPLWKQRLKEKE